MKVPAGWAGRTSWGLLGVQGDKDKWCDCGRGRGKLQAPRLALRGQQASGPHLPALLTVNVAAPGL